MPRYAIVTPYYKEPREILTRCLDSVRRQTIPADHILIADGFAQDWLDGEGVIHLRLPQAAADYCNTPRGLGALYAARLGYDGIGLLDADNWYEADHVALCAGAAAKTANPVDVVAAKRRLLRFDGRPFNVPDEPNHIDTSCYWFAPSAYHLLSYWATQPRELAPLCDRVYYAMLKAQSARIAHTDRITVNYTWPYEGLYRAFGETPPPGFKPTIDMRPIYEWLADLPPDKRRQVALNAGVDMVPEVTAALKAAGLR